MDVALLQIIAPIVGPLITAIVRWLMPEIPKALLPVIATVCGAATAATGGADTTSALTLGASGVAVREIADQARKGLGLK